MSIYKSWKRYHFENDITAGMMDNFFKVDKPVVGGGDTETTGLHIIKDKPFLMIFGWLFPGEEYGRVFTFYPTQRNMKLFFDLAKKLKVFTWWNTKFDLHMMTNIGWRYEESNLMEGLAIARLVVEAIPARDGGDSLALKDIGRNYVDPAAADSEHKVKDVLERLNKERVRILAASLKQFTMEGVFTSNGKPKKWGKGAIEDFLKDITNEYEDLPEDVREVFEEWNKEYPEPGYYEAFLEDKEAMIEYAGNDVITMLEFYRKAIPILIQKQQKETLKRENRVILPLYRMERIGMRVDRDYLETSRKKLKKLIIEKRQKMCAIGGQIFTVGQHELIKTIYKEKFGIELEKADKKAMKDIARRFKGKPAGDMAKLIRDLRRLEKWYSTYCVRLLKISEYDGRFYTQIAQCSAVSGRVGSDGQQFPKERILTDEGVAYEEEHGEGKAPESMEIFFPRRAFLPTDRGSRHGYSAIYYLDFSQIELRNQADYTLRVSGGDMNLCRAYMPFQCRHYKTGEYYDFRTPKPRSRWNEKQEDGKTSAWLMPEENYKPWEPTDVHSETTHNALLALGYECLEKYKSYRATAVMKEEAIVFGRILDKDAFKMARYKGKIFNFMKNYGGGLGAAMDQLDLPEIAAKALIKGYEVAFPGVILYQEAIYKAWEDNGGYVKNMYQRRYYIDNRRKVYKLGNYCIQGTCADMLKECIIEIDALLMEYKSRFIMNIHDELQFEIWKGEEFLIEKLLKIMQTHDWHYVPVVSDVEIATDTWATKKDWEAA